MMNEFEQAEERRKRQREEIKQKRIRQLRRRMTISGCILLCIIIALAAFAVNVAKKKKLAAEQKKQLEQEIAQMNESLNDCYNTFLTDNGMSAEKSDVTYLRILLPGISSRATSALSPPPSVTLKPPHAIPTPLLFSGVSAAFASATAFS